MFNKYFQDELSFLRELGQEFASAYPAIAPMLAETGGDPDVERLLEGVAFLTGKLRQKIDDEIPEVIHSVASLLFPHFLRQIPATSLVQFSPKSNVVREKVVIPRGTECASIPVDGTNCQFRTTQEVVLLPLEIENVRVDTNAQLAETLRIQFKVTGGTALPSVGLTRIRFYIAGERRVQDDLRLWIGDHLKGVTLAVEERTEDKVVATLAREQIKLVGFDDDEALFPYPKTAYRGYRLLQEYFCLPQKFAFFDLVDLDQVDLARLGESFSLHLEFRDALPKNTRITKDTFRLNCTPVVNLFEHPTDPIKPSETQHEYLLRPSGDSPEAVEIHSVDAVVGIARRSSSRRTIPPFLSFAHETNPVAGQEPIYHQSHLRPATIGEGVDIYLTFGSPRDAGAPPELDVISVEATCTNRLLPAQLKAGDISVATASSPAVASFTNIIGVSPPLPPPVGNDLQWRVLSHMAMSYRSLVEPEMLRATVEIYNFQALHDRQAARANQLRVAAIKDVRVSPIDRLYRGAPVRGVRADVDLDEQGFAGEGEMYLFASILSEMFASYVSLNSFTQLQVRGTNSNVVYTWAPKSGNLTLI